MPPGVGGGTGVVAGGGNVELGVSLGPGAAVDGPLEGTAVADPGTPLLAPALG
ncbi:MAG: hypothetical protein ABWX96_15370 [Propionibacteriaceae bacterium]